MAINQVQMQPGLSLAEFIQHYGTEAQCEQALATSRWPRGFACPACRCRLHTTFQRAGRGYWQCQRCHHQTTVTAGTIFDSTKLALTVCRDCCEQQPQHDPGPSASSRLLSLVHNQDSP